MPGQRPYYEFDHEGERKTIEADTWIQVGDEIVFAKWVIETTGRREEEVARFAGIDYRSINRVIP
ncbi:MAG: hypothetical protein ABR540_14105 [Acidimicrobiales bacterium]